MDSKWAWHNVVYELISELNITEKEAYKMNYISVLNWKSYFYERNKVREAQAKQSKSKF